MYYGLLTKITGGWSTDEISRQESMRQLYGKVRATYPFNVIGLDGKEQERIACCYGLSHVSEGETVWLNREIPQQLEVFWADSHDRPIFITTKSSNSYIWRMSGYIGFIKNPDGYMHELCFMEYDSATRQGAAFVAIKEEVVKAHPELFAGIQLVDSPYSDGEILEVATRWGISPFLYKGLTVERFRASQHC